MFSKLSYQFDAAAVTTPNADEVINKRSFHSPLAGDYCIPAVRAVQQRPES